MGRRVLMALGVLVALWAAGWFAAARSVERAGETWFAEAAAGGLGSGYGHLSVAGFPARLTLAVEGPRLADPLRGLGWRAGGLRASAAAWAPRRIRFAPQGPQVLTLGGADIPLRAAAVAGVVQRRGGAQTVTLDLRGLRAAAPALTLSLDTARAQARIAGAEASLDLALAGLDLGGLDWPTALAPRPEGAVTRLDLRGTVAFGPAAADTRAVAGVTLHALDLAWDGVRMRGAGEMRLTPDGRPEGRIDLEVEGGAALLALAAAVDLVDPEVAATWARLLSALEGDGPAPGVAALPIVARDGWLSVGPLPLGRAPRIVRP